MSLRRATYQPIALRPFYQNQNIFPPDKASVHLAHRFDPSHDWVPGLTTALWAPALALEDLFTVETQPCHFEIHDNGPSSLLAFV
jgi:hypothetical protein